MGLSMCINFELRARNLHTSIQQSLNHHPRIPQSLILRRMLNRSKTHPNGTKRLQKDWVERYQHNASNNPLHNTLPWCIGMALLQNASGARPVLNGFHSPHPPAHLCVPRCACRCISGAGGEMKSQ